MADYAITTILEVGFADAVERTRAVLAEEGFGILTEIDVAATMKKKLDVDMAPWLILGACNPPLAHRALTLEPSLGLLLPCNVVVRDLGDDKIRVEAMNPDIMVTVAGSTELEAVATQARDRLTAALSTLSDVTT